MTEKTYTLMTPGPVQLPREVLAALSRPMEHHRTPEFIALWNRVLARLQSVFATHEPVFVHTSTGSGAMESALINCLSPGDESIVVVSGKFGERWAEMAEAFGGNVHRLEVPWGQTVRVQDVAEALDRFPNAKAVATQACETSTGVLHPVRELAALMKNKPQLFMVDAITALGALPIPMDEWGIDVMIGGSQKAFMLPTGISFIALSAKAWKVAETSTTPRYYFDLRRERVANQAGESFFSASVSHIRALDRVLEIFLHEGLHRVHDRIQALSRATLRATALFGVEPFAEIPSPSVTALKVPDGVDGQKLRAQMETENRVIVMGGQDRLKGKIIRIGHMGAISDEDLLRTLESLSSQLAKLNPGRFGNLKTDEAFSAARSELAKSPAVLT